MYYIKRLSSITQVLKTMLIFNKLFITTFNLIIDILQIKNLEKQQKHFYTIYSCFLFFIKHYFNYYFVYLFATKLHYSSDYILFYFWVDLFIFIVFL